MATPHLTARTVRDAAKLRLAVSSAAPVYASASSYTHFCVIPNANALRCSRPAGAICSERDR
jgi:hypothetical protein